MSTLRRTAALFVLMIAATGCAKYAGTPHEVTFKSRDGVELHGSLIFPKKTSGKVPGVILLHGAEPATRSMVYRMHANIFLDQGMAVLLYDKRGAGESEGDHDTATYSQLIEDALAAIDLLQQREEIDPEGIGLVGASESGWLTPEIAERSGNLAFVINKVGPCLSRRETGAWEVYHEFLAEKVREESARAQTEVVQRLWDYYVSPTPEKESALETTLAEWADKDDSRLPTALTPASPEAVENLSYDPGPYLERLTTPMLYLYGSEDVNVPSSKCAERLSALREAGRPVSFHVFEGEGHELGGVGITGYDFADGYRDLLSEFARKHLNERRKQAG